MEQHNLVGKTILGYEVVSQIGVGSFGTVYKVVKNNALGNYTRALKHLTFPTKKRYSSVLNSMGGDAEKADSYFAEMLNDLASETTLLSSLSERKAAHIVRYYESDLKTQKDPLQYDVYILMEYATPLSDYLEQHPHFTVRDVVKVGLDVLQGIGVCHDNGVIHRDVKEDNIFVSSTGEYEIGDFGVSKVLKDSSRAESLKGTPNYLAPEVYLNQSGYTKSVDLYALGIVLYRLLNHGRNPFMPPYPEPYLADDEDNAFEMRMRGIEPPAPALGSSAIHEVINQALANEVDRYQNAEAFAADLSLALEQTPKAELDEEIGYVSASGVADGITLDAVAPADIDQSQQTLRVGIGQERTEELKPGQKTETSDYCVCPSCGASNRASNHFCESCGKPLSGNEAQTALWNQSPVLNPNPNPVPAPVSSDFTSGYPAPQNKKNNVAKTVMLSLACVCGVLVVAGVLFVTLNPFGLTTGIFSNSTAAYEQIAKESQEAAQTSQEQTQTAQEAAENAQGQANEAQSQLEDIKAQNEETQKQLEEAQKAQKQAEQERKQAEEAQAQAEAEKIQAQKQAAEAQAQADAEAAARVQEQRVTTTSTTTAAPQVQSSNPTPFWGIWTDASKSPDNIQNMAQQARDAGFPDVRIIFTNDWTNLNPEPWYVLTMGTYSSREEAEAHMDEVLGAGYDEAYINYTGDYVG